MATPSGLPGRGTGGASAATGLWQAVVAYSVWGFFPVYFTWLRGVPPLEVIAHRIVWSFGLLVLTAVVTGEIGRLQETLTQARALGIYLVSAALISVNWLVFVGAVEAHEILQTSLGYFLTPLISVLLGVVFFHERLRPWQGRAIALAGVGVLLVAYTYSAFPWIALSLALSFGLYGAVKKVAPLNPFLGMTLETGLLVVPALAYLSYQHLAGQGAFLNGRTATDLLLLGAGPVTVIPLLLFASAAQKIPLALLGLLQYIAPSLQFLVGIFFYREPFTGTELSAFLVVWIALALFAAEGLVMRQTRGSAAARGRPSTEDRGQSP